MVEWDCPLCKDTFVLPVREKDRESIEVYSKSYLIKTLQMGVNRLKKTINNYFPSPTYESPNYDFKQFVKCPKCNGEYIVHILGRKVTGYTLASIEQSNIISKALSRESGEITRVEESIKTLISIEATLISIVTLIYGFLKISPDYFNPSSYLIPLGAISIWIISIVTLFFGDHPKTFTTYFDDPEGTNAALDAILKRKKFWLLMGTIIFSIGFLLLAIGIFPPLFHPSDVNLIVSNSSIPIISDVGIGIIPGSNITESVTLLNHDSNYLILTKDKEKISLNSDIIQGYIVVNN